MPILPSVGSQQVDVVIQSSWPYSIVLLTGLALPDQGSPGKRQLCVKEALASFAQSG